LFISAAPVPWRAIAVVVPEAVAPDAMPIVRVALDVEWNAKDGNLDRDLSAYRAWHEAGVISAAVLITQDRIALKALAEKLWIEYQETLPDSERSARLPIDLGTSTTTNLEKAALRVRRGVMGTCPLLVVAATQATWNGKPYSAA